MTYTGEVTSLGQLIEAIVSSRATTPYTRAALIGISGIDGSGKGFITRSSINGCAILAGASLWSVRTIG
jgi:hypothetical protein